MPWFSIHSTTCQFSMATTKWFFHYKYIWFNISVWLLTVLIKWALCIRSNHREKMPLSRPMHGSELNLVASGRILLTNGLVSLELVSLLLLFVSSALFLFSTWWLLTADYPSCFHFFSWFYCYISTLCSSSDYFVLPPRQSVLSDFLLCSHVSLQELDCPFWFWPLAWYLASALGYLYCVLVTMYMVLDLAFDLLSAWPLICSESASAAPLDCLLSWLISACLWIFLLFFPPLVLMVWDLAAWQEPKCGLAN